MQFEGHRKGSDRKIVILLITYALHPLCITEDAADTHIFVYEYKVDSQNVLSIHPNLFTRQKLKTKTRQ